MMSECLRKEVLVRTMSDGRIEFLDPLLQARHTLSSSESAALSSRPWPNSLIAKLDSANLLENSRAENLRNQYWNANSVIRFEPSIRVIDPSYWSLAQQLPEIVRPEWKEPEKWRRLAETFAAGNPFAVLEDFLEPQALLDEVSTLEFKSHRSQATQAGRTRVLDGRIFQLMRDPALQKLVHGLLHVPINRNVIIQAWELKPGDYLKVHTDGPRYLATFSIGCSPNWCAQYGGALSFGECVDGVWKAQYRWLPELGTALLFRPRSDLWHWVETVIDGTRHTFTGWWVEEGYQLGEDWRFKSKIQRLSTLLSD